jgi:hypothetical protein
MFPASLILCLHILYIILPLSLDGISLGFVSRKPTWAESEQYPHIELTSPMSWDPSF